MIWFTADYHLSHKNIIKYTGRPFEDIQEMDRVLIKNLEEKITHGDVLYILGDLTFNEQKANFFFEKFKNIEIHFIIGNHDSSEVIRVAEQYCTSMSRIKDIKIEGQSITLCHYAMRVWNKSHYNAWQLYGHSHGKLKSVGKQYDIGVDNNKLYPISFEELQIIMNKLPNNFNYISQEKRVKI
ncbi:MAG: metallophosphoesterase family protein [Promethearchaeota archaeon]